MKGIYTAAFVLLASLASAQTEQPYSASDPTLPLWVKKMYEPVPDVGEVVSLYNQYYATRPVEKNEHTQYYKRWIKTITQEPILPWATQSERELILANEQAYLASKQVEANMEGPSAPWAGVGPWDFDKEAASRSYAPGAAHLYTVEQSMSNTDLLYAGAATSGVWKSIDKGQTWTPVAADLPLTSVLSVEIDHTNEQIVYFGGAGQLYKTTDGGSTWGTVGDTSFTNYSHTIRDIVMHPSNSQILYIASSNGYYRTTDAGTSFTRMMTGVFQEIEINPADSNMMYFIRQVADSTEFYKSTDGGLTLIQKTNGWPVPAAGDEQKRVEMATTPAAPHKIWALATGKANGGSGLYGIYISNDEGESWTFSCCGPQPGGPPSLSNINMMAWADDGTDDGGQYYYDLALEVEDNDSNVVHVAGVNHWVSTDGGINFTCPAKWSHPDKPEYVHADIHDIHSYGNDLWFACDGGIFYSDDKGDTIDRRMFGIQGTDFWGFGTGYWDGEVMVGGTYHNGTLLKDNSVYINDWLSTQGGDNYRGFVNHGDGRKVYHDGGGKLLPGDRTKPITGFPFSKNPNASYIIGASSTIEFDQRNYNKMYSGEGTSLWLSEDGGNGFTEVYDFGEDVTEIKVSPADPGRIYVCTFIDWWGLKRIYRSEDTGSTWTDITPSITLVPNDRWVPYNLAVDEDDPDKIWFARTSMYGGGYPNLNGSQVFRSTDGGANWTNFTTSTLDGESITNMFHQHGTMGGVYLGTRRAVYYRNDTMTDWVLHSNQLPAHTFSTLLVPYYRKGLIRNGGNRGVWEAEFYEPSMPRAQISADRTTSYCLRDTVRFADHSVLNGDSASWQWNFAGATPASSTDRTPEVVYNAPGKYDVTLTVTDKYGTDSQTLTDFIEILDECSPDTIPGFALQCDNSGDYANVPTFPLHSNTLTLSAWIKPNVVLPDYTAFVMARQHAAGINIRPGMELAYHWPGGSWSWASGLFVPIDKWSHVALVVTPDSVTVYLNGVGSTHVVAVDSGDFRGGLDIGTYRGWGSRNFYGKIDEVCVWDRPLSQDEIRDRMHLTKIPSSDPSLLAYYQFNRDQGQATDRVALNHANLAGGAYRVVSTVPAGGGTSHRMVVNSGGPKQFTGTGVTMTFPATGGYPDNEMVVTRINLEPDTIPGTEPVSRSYWVVNNYGSSIFNTLDEITFENIGIVSNTNATDPTELKLFDRYFYSDGPTWGTHSEEGDAVVVGFDGSVTFSNTGIYEVGQFVIQNEGDLTSGSDTRMQPNNGMVVSMFPNPVNQGKEISVRTNIATDVTLEVYDVNGRFLHRAEFKSTTQVPTTQMQPGIYMYKLKGGGYMRFGSFVVE